jgi:hypothetical protein
MTIEQLSKLLGKKPNNLKKELDTFLGKVTNKEDYLVEDNLTDKCVEMLTLNQKGNQALKYRLWFYETDRSTNIWEELQPKMDTFKNRTLLYRVVTKLEFPEAKETSIQVTKRLKTYINLIDTLDISTEVADLKVKEKVEMLTSVGVKGKDTFNIVKEMLLETYKLKELSNDDTDKEVEENKQEDNNTEQVTT